MSSCSLMGSPFRRRLVCLFLPGSVLIPGLALPHPAMRYVSCIAASLRPYPRSRLEGRPAGAGGHRQSSPYWERPLPIFADEPESSGLRGCLAARPNLELAQDRRDMVIDGLLRQDQSLGDLALRSPSATRASTSSSAR